MFIHALASLHSEPVSGNHTISLAYPELLRQCLPRPRFEPREPGPQVQAVCPFHMLWKLCHAPWFVAMSVFPCYHSLLDYKLLGQRFALFPLVLKLPCLLNTILEAKMRQWVGGQDRDIRAWLPPPTGPWAAGSSNTLALLPPHYGYGKQEHCVEMFEVFVIFIK